MGKDEGWRERERERERKRERLTIYFQYIFWLHEAKFPLIA